MGADHARRGSSKNGASSDQWGLCSRHALSIDRPGAVHWQPELFVAPFDFDLTAVNAVHFPVSSNLPEPTGTYCFELAGGDVLFGTLIALDDAQAELDVQRGADSPRAVQHQSHVSLEVQCRPDLPGPQRPDRLAQRPPQRKGGRRNRDNRGPIRTGLRSAVISSFPARATLEFEISWKNRPDFVFALGVNDDEKSIQRAFRFEVWERDLIIQRETEQEADVASVGEVYTGPGRVHLIAYLDQERGRVLVFSADGKPLADLKVAGGQQQVLGSISLANKRGDLRLERMRIGRWNGEPPRDVARDRSRIHRVDGSIVYGQVKRFDAASSSRS